MKKLFIFACFMPAVVFCGEKLKAAYSRIPDAVKNPEIIKDEIWKLDGTNKQVYAAAIVKAAKAYPCSPSEKSNLVEKVERNCELATNLVPTVRLSYPDAARPLMMQEFGKVDVSSKAVIDYADPNMPNLDVAVESDPIGAIPRVFLAKPVIEHGDGYPGQNIRK